MFAGMCPSGWRTLLLHQIALGIYREGALRCGSGRVPAMQFKVATAVTERLLLPEPKVHSKECSTLSIR